MQQRRVRLGDVLDDYCPRERRITNHVVVAMIDDEVKQTRCTTCDADHEYKHARVPPQRRKRAGVPAGGPPQPLEPLEEEAESSEEIRNAESPTGDLFEPPAVAAEADTPLMDAAAEEDGPVHRRLIRATLPRPNGQTPERREPEFTVRQTDVRGRSFDQKNGPRHGRRPMRAHDGQPQRFAQAPRHGSGHGSRPGPGGPGHRPAGDRPGQPGGQRHRRGGRKRGR